MTMDKPIIALYDSFLAALNARNKERCIQLVREALDTGSISIPELYEDVLAMSLCQIASNENDQKIAIWEEHIQCGIVRAGIEIAYPYLMKLVARPGGSQQQPVAVVLCQAEECHELGARMATDFLILLGFDAFFIGANTPAQEALAAIKALKPRLVCISVANFFHLTKLQRLIHDMRSLQEQGQVPSFSIVAGGYAVKNTPGAVDKIKPDYFAHCYRDLARIAEEVR